MIVAEEAIRNTAGRVKAPLKFRGCTNFPIYHVDRFHTYRNCPKNMGTDVLERVMSSIQDYTQHNSAVGGRRGSQGIQYGRGQTSSTIICSMFADIIAQIYQLWDEEGFGSLY